jgi:hypothetical protein
MVDKAALGQVFSEYFGSLAKHSTNFSIIIITRGWHNRPFVAAVPSGPNWTPPPTIPIKKIMPDKFYWYVAISSQDHDDDDDDAGNNNIFIIINVILYYIL